jgi:hypothetical protein
MPEAKIHETVWGLDFNLDARLPLTFARIVEDREGHSYLLADSLGTVKLTVDLMNADLAAKFLAPGISQSR